MEKELVELFEAAKKAADAAAAPSNDGGAEESRCLDALRQLKKFPVTYQILVSTQVGKRLRHLTKHPKKKIQDYASDLIEMWKDIVIKETNKNKKNGNGNSKETSKIGSPSAESVKVENLQKSSSMKVERVSKVEQFDRNGSTSSVKYSRSASAVSEKNSVKVEKTDSVVKVERMVKEEKKISIEKKPSGAAGPPKLTSMIKSKDAARDKIRELLVEAFSKVPGEADEDVMDEVNASDPIRVAVSVESVMFENWGGSTGAQKAKYRSIMFNLKDPKNPDFRRKVLLGLIKPERMTNLSTTDMASDQRKRENEEIAQKALFECERGGAPKATTDQFKCGRCGQRKTTYYQLQTRSADEPMTTFVTCVNCNNHWKFC
ncbi:transcription elongation factor TFIIS-like [Cucurbita pepo subsp. pepo]|uniref:transcription elongation factor TFIIS-like n=1 Tax=Cucurbita pepo subsp. pepo TaxID=3664 RepID=UPI000C9D7CF2|nr:transcription elongation factor TFIIS-like [Cucurbita pepo subsp. pepo]